jgi:NAD-dependent SIR2 family protein deacetylase
MSTVDIPDLARTICRSDNVVFLTGAGLSVASGLAPYRKSKDAVWSRFITDWGTIEKFHQDPAQWWREFWIKAHGDLGKLDVKPNPGHDAITQIIKRNPAHLVITQNIDGLHRASGVPEEQLVEIHGRHDRFVCTDNSCEGFLNAVPSVDLSMLDRGEVPRCTTCHAPLRPNVLLFDEMYYSHPTYNMRKARNHLNDAELIIFVGTSFSVGITDYAVRAGEYAKARLININIEPINNFGFENILGPSEETLPKLADEVSRRAGARPPPSVTS